MKCTLIIKRNNEQVNELNYDGINAMEQLTKVLIWKLNEKKSTKIDDGHKTNGDRYIKAIHKFSNMVGNYEYIYIFEGMEISGLPYII